MKGIFSSRKFWALIVALVVLLAGYWLPDFHLDEEAAIGLAVVAASYILGTAVDPGPGGWRGVIGSRKFWTAMVGLGVVVADGFGLRLPEALPQETLIWLCVALGGYISGVALEAKRFLG